MKLPILLALASCAAITVGQTPVAPPAAFDAFTIKAAPPPSGNFIRINNQVDPTRVTIENLPLRQIILNAFELKPYQLTAPDWMNTERFNITAVTATPATKEQMNQLMQKLLTEQFQLKLHHDSKVMDAYALTVADGGSKLQPPGPDGVKMDLPFKVQGMPERPLTKDQPMMMMRMDQGGIA
ncbi:MAG TPA: TIGR03435 family protein, partial [Terriglobales bacterium]|nr:TIGR03435 family protein [Terriglobales bacterium]